MDWKKAIGFGALLWLILFAVASLFVGFKVMETLWARVVIVVISGALAYVLAGKIKPTKAAVALQYSGVWVVTGLVLDAIITTRFAPAVFQDWSLWLGYALVLLIPLAQVKKAGV